MFWCNNCNGKKCIIGSKGLTSFNKKDISKRINNSVRLHSSLHLMKKSTQTINALRPTFKNQSDRFNSSGVDKKHNSYARYLGRKKGKTICCCTCTQLVTPVGSHWPTNIPIGATIFGNEGQGIVVAINKSFGKINSITIRSKYCLKPYYLGTIPYFRIPAASDYPSPNHILLGLTIKTINIC